MSEIQRILDQLDRAFEADAWHGPPVQKLLHGVFAKQAAAKPAGVAHSIWEIVLHMMTWQDVVRRRLGGEVIGDLPPELDWPPVPNPGENAWRQAVEDLTQSKLKLRQVIARLADNRLSDQVAGKNYSVYVMLHGVIQHNLYHAGQIAILKKLSSVP